MELGYLFVKFLGEYVDLSIFVFVSVSVFPEINLGEDLVSERS